MYKFSLFLKYGKRKISGIRQFYSPYDLEMTQLLNVLITDNSTMKTNTFWTLFKTFDNCHFQSLF